MKQTLISDEVLKVLASAKLDGDGLHLVGQLEPKLYQKVKKVLEALGAKWNRGKATHVFTDANAQIKIASAIQQGSFDNEKKTFDFFPTPDHVAVDMVQLIEPALWTAKEVKRVLEPSAGHGALIAPIFARNEGVVVHAIEKNPSAFEALKKFKAPKHGGLNLLHADFMEVDPVIYHDRPFDAVIMNPPFSNGHDVLHVCNAMLFLKNGGRLVTIVSPAYTFREGTKWNLFRNMLEQNKIIVEKDLPSGTFKESGTNIRTRLICLEKSTK